MSRDKCKRSQPRPGDHDSVVPVKRLCNLLLGREEHLNPNIQAKMDNAKLPNLIQVYPTDDNPTDPEANIIAVHGLGANPATTWVKENVNWLSDPKMLPSRIPQARIWTFNYQSKWIGDSPINRLNTLARHLLEFILVKINNNPEKPLIFIAHSFGGILVAEAITLSKICHDYAPILRSTTGVVFLGTPFRGSSSAEQAEMIANVAAAFGYNSSDNLLKHLRPGSEKLLDVAQNFSIVASEEKLNIVCFFEQLPTPVSPRILKLISPNKEVEVVSEASACLDGYIHIGLNTTHTQMNEFNDPDDGNYQMVSDKVRSFVAGSHEVFEARSRRRSPLKALFSVPNLQNPNFVGREDILKEVVEKMAFKRDHQARVAIWGLGGVGKSQIATRYAYTVRESDTEQILSVFWIHAANRARFEQSYLEVGSKAGVSVPEGPSVDKLRLVADWLRDENNGRWIMIVDNADDISLFKDIKTQSKAGVEKSVPGLSNYLPRCDHGSILFTSRSEKVCLDLGNMSALIRVTDMMPEECERLLRRTVQDCQLDEEMPTLITLLGRLPLALAQAAAFICRNALTTSDYVKLYKESESCQTDLLSQEFPADGRDGVPNALAATLAISFHDIKQSEPITAHLLSMMAFFDRQDIPKALLPRGESTAIQFEMAIETLQVYSLIAQSSSGKSYDIHELIQASMRHWLRLNNETSLLIRQALAVMVAQFPWPEFQNWPDCARYLPHARSVLEHVRVERIEGNDEVTLLSDTAHYLFSQGEYADAESLQLRAKDISHRINGAEHFTTLTCIAALIATYVKNGNWKAGKALQVMSIERLQKMLEAERPRSLQGVMILVQFMFSLSETHLNQRQRESLESLALKIFEITKRELGPEHLATIALMSLLALLYGQQSRLDDAKSMCDEIFEIKKRKFGLEHPDTAHNLNGLAILHDMQGQWQDAGSMYLGILEIRKNTLGPEHPDTIRSMSDLAETYSQQGRLRDAESIHLDVLQIQKKTPGLEHPDTLKSMNNLAVTYYRQGRWLDAGSMYLDVLEIRKKALGLEHPATLKSINNLAVIFSHQGRFRDAESIYLDVLEIRKKTLGLEHPDTLNSMNNLAVMYSQQGRFREAESIQLKALETAKWNFGPEHPSTLSYMHSLASIYKSQHRDRDAIALMTEIVRSRRQKLGSEHPKTVQSTKIREEWQKEQKD